MPRIFAEPPKWTDDDLRAQRAESEELFKIERREEGPKAFAAVYERVKPHVLNLLLATGDLTKVTGQVFLDDPDAWQAARYVCAPPVSQEDLWTLVGGPKFKRVPPAYAEDTSEAVRLVLDLVRFPWLESGRPPTEHERDAAVMATSALWAAQLLGTQRRGQASQKQEAAAATILESIGFSLDLSRSPMDLPDDLARGSFSRERIIAGTKCDVPIRLRDGRLLALECKVSNGPKNGWKRVSREVGGKANKWREAFGIQALTGVVLAGVFDLKCLKDARDQGVILFWQHDLETLGSFILRADQ